MLPRVIPINRRLCCLLVRSDIITRCVESLPASHSGHFDELSDLDLFDVPEVRNELERQIAGRLARIALAERAPFYVHELSLEVRKHAEALVDELFVL